MSAPPSSPAHAITVISNSPAATRALAARIATVAAPGDLICLWVGLGLGVVGTISSPTFVLMAEYDGRLPLFHLDLYRLADAADVLGGGLLDERQASGVTLVEWPDRLGSALPDERLDVRIDGLGDDTRRITFGTDSSKLARYVAAADGAAAAPGSPPAAAFT